MSSIVLIVLSQYINDSTISQGINDRIMIIQQASINSVINVLVI